MKKKLKNSEMAAMLNQLRPILSHRDKIGYDKGRPIIGIKVDSPNFQKFCDEMAPFNEMEHEVELMLAKYTDAIGCLSGEEILGIDWMLED